MTWLEPAPKRRKSTRFRLATINALGDSHTRPGGNKFGRWLQSARRTVLLTQVIVRRRLSIVGLQEFQAPQQRVFRSRMNPWRMHAKKDNAVVWLRARFAHVTEGTLDIPYFGGDDKPMPWVILRCRITGRQFAFLSTHNPASVRGPALEHRKEGWRREAAWAAHMLNQPGVVAAFTPGDKNAPPGVFKPFIEKRGGKVAGIPADLPNTPGRGIDWIVGWGDVHFTDHKTSKTRRIARMSDHPVVQATAHI